MVISQWSHVTSHSQHHLTRLRFLFGSEGVEVIDDVVRGWYFSVLVEEDETPEGDHEEQAIFEESKDPPQPRLPKRSNRGIHSHFYGFHTHIKKALEEFGEAGIDELQCLSLRRFFLYNVGTSRSPLDRA
jgi:hypothetical protein